MALTTVQNYITIARDLLQDTLAPYRYTDGELAEALGLALLEARRHRPELFIGSQDNVQDIARTTPLATNVTMDQMYRYPLVLFMVGHVMSREEEESLKQDAANYKLQFVSKMLTIAS